MTTVVHLKRKNGAVVVSCDIYIGRAAYQGGWSLPESKWANPFRLRADGKNRDQVLADYEDHVRKSPVLMRALPELRGKRLGCWCAPLPCHGDVLVRLLAEQPAQSPSAVDAIYLATRELIPDDDSLWDDIGI